MIIRHDTGNIKYRAPFGALKCGENLTLTLHTVGAGRGAECSLLLRPDGEGTVCLPMEKRCFDADADFSVSVSMPAQPGLVFYSFAIDTAAGRIIIAPGQSGEAEEYDPQEAPAEGWQITVYNLSPVPEWYRDSIAYQIFPDRFNRGSDYELRRDNALRAREGLNGPQRVYEDDWDTKPYYIRGENNDIAAWNFWGGTIKGIEEKLGYIKSLGVGVLYINPIFSAASNHKYDTADYFTVDPGFGDEAALVSLINAAKKLGIGIILDGVFNHVGADSKYFDRYGNYGGGAYSAGKDSQYYDWFSFGAGRDDYKGWWGVKDLPEIRETNPDYVDMICGENGVIRYWIRRGIKGWRLDVADEMPDEFIRRIREAARQENPEAVIIGEVWEDASNKIAYGKRRAYFMGDELDGVMNYPLRTAVHSFLLGKSDARDFKREMDVLREHYPPENYLGCLNLIGSHDRARLMTLMGDGEEATQKLTDAEKRDYTLTEDMRALAGRRVRLAALMQYSVPGVPCVYYGDEAGAQGFTDPYNRGPFPWEDMDEGLVEFYRVLGQLRSQYRPLREGNVSFSAVTAHVAAITREKDGESVITVVNRGVFEHQSVAIPAKGDAVDLLTGIPYKAQNGRIYLNMMPTTAVMLYFCGGKPRGKTLERSSGILCHISSIPRGEGESPLGKAGKNFVDFLARSGQRLWQVLPVNPSGEDRCPYFSYAVFAGEERFCEGLTAEDDKILSPDGYNRFCKENSYWLDDYALFVLYREKYGSPWQSWPAAARDRLAVDADLESFRGRIEEIKYSQYRFFAHWGSLREYAHSKGISIVGDIPLYAAPDSADCWAHREMFMLDSSGNPAFTSGAPADYFNPDGQGWGSPVYNWDNIRRDGWRWWKERFAVALRSYDRIRFDHFRGFSAYYAIPDGMSPKYGNWFPGPAGDFFEAVSGGQDEIPVVVEDLGHLDGGVYSLKRSLGLPGMLVWQFNRAEMAAQSEEDMRATVYYSATHDNETLPGWYARTQPGCDPVEESEKAMDTMALSQAGWVICQLQDVLGLDNSARMNVPGVVGGNWSWQCPEGALTAELEKHLYTRAKRAGRI